MSRGNCIFLRSRLWRRSARGACCPGRVKFPTGNFQSFLCYFLYLQKVAERLPRSGKGFNFVSGKLLFGWAESRFAEPRNSLQRERFSCFSLVRKEPKVHQRFANLWTPGTIQSSAGRDFAKISGGSCRNRFCLQNGGVKALNRCDVPALQRKDLERR